MRQTKKFNIKGFSMVELIVGVAIIGALAAIGIPSYQRFSAKAKQAEAKSSLSGLAAANKSFFAEYAGFTSRFDSMGFSPEGRIYYRIGFNADTAPPAEAPQGTATCRESNNGSALPVCAPGFSVNWQVRPSAANIPGLPGGAVVGAATFNASALGRVNGIDIDSWSIDQDLNLDGTNSTL